MIIRKTLNNKLRLVMEPMKNYASVALGVWVDAGSANETIKNNGIAHVTEHMVFKGTFNRSAKDIADEMTAIGGNLDAYTSKECTCFYTKTLGEYAPIALEIIADMIKNSKVDEQELKKELGVILDEMDMYEDDADELVHELLQKEVWKDHPLGYIISGEKDVVREFTRDDVLDFMRRYYTGRHMVVSIAGNFDPDDMTACVEKLFGDIPEGEVLEEQPTAIYKPALVYRKKDIEQMHVDIAFDCIAYDHPDKYVMAVVNSILGGNLNSRLFQKVREEMGLTYTIYSYGSSFKECGLFQIYAAMAPEQTAKVLDVILEVVEDMRINHVTEKELQLTKQQIRTELLMATESTHNRMESNAKSCVYLNSWESLDETIKKIEALTLEDVDTFMNNYLNVSKASICLVGNDEHADKEQVNEVLKRWNILSLEKTDGSWL